MMVRMKTMKVMDRTGHTNIEWNPDDSNSVAEATYVFNRYVLDGYQAWKMEVKHDSNSIAEETGERINTFDPQADRILIFPQLVGG